MALRLNVEMLTKACRMTPSLHRIDSHGAKHIDQCALAARMGVAESTVYRLIEGRIQPGSKTVVALLRTFPDLDFDDLFAGEDVTAA